MMQPSRHRFHGDLAVWLSKLPAPDGKPFVVAFEHGSLAVELFRPRTVDTQTRHSRDEVYVVVRGQGEFVHGPNRHAFQCGDLLFVPAGLDHRFENFSEDLALWVLFYGPEGGEEAQRTSSL